MDQAAGLCCRQSPLRGAIGGLILCAAFVGGVFLARRAGAPAPVWIVCAILAALIVPLVVVDMVAKLRSTNWLLWVRPDGLWVNLRWYQNRHLPDAATVLHLPYKEIACARRHLETWSTPNPRGAVGIEVGTGAAPGVRWHAGTQWKEESLELRLESDDTREITLALANERGLRAGIKGTHQAVTVPSPGVVRIAWRGHGNDVAPGLDRVLARLRMHIELAEPTRTDRPNWLQLSDAELAELIAQLVRSGDPIAATQLLIHRRGCSATEAHKLVEELDTKV